jgi:hypothetical protein
MHMKERPIIFTAESVRAILDGTKTQTRRVIKPQPDSTVTGLVPRTTYAGNVLWSNALWETKKYGRLIEMNDRKCPYGHAGDHLWVRETWVKWDGGLVYLEKSLDKHGNEDADSKRCRLDYGVTWKSPLFMPRWASRITLEIVGVKAERLNEISETDAKAEGVTPDPNILEPKAPFPARISHRSTFAAIWDGINAKRGYPWDSNCWVWAIEFRRVTP